MTNPDSRATQATQRSLQSYILEVTLDVIWRQWHALGAMTSTDRHTNSLVDPEALILMSLALQKEQPRLGDILGDWITINSDLISVQRIRNLAAHFGPSARTSLGSLARIAVEEGKDHRWKVFLGPHDPGLQRRAAKGSAKKRAVRARPLEPAALMLRLRLAFGVGIRADMLTFLLTAEDEVRASISAIASATNYTVAPVRKAAQNLVEARFVEQTEDTRSEYHVNRDTWRELLGVRALPAWRGWAVRMIFVNEFLDWAASTEERSTSPYIYESKGLALVKKHSRAFRWTGRIRSQPDSLLPGANDQLSFAIHDLGEWMKRVA
jgi:hypothetical protein